MTNREVSDFFKALANYGKLHGENAYKTRSYEYSTRTIKAYPKPVFSLKEDELLDIKGIGKATASKILELRSTGKIKTLDKLKELTPIGIQELMKIRGLGPKKILPIWKDLGLTTPGEVLYACSENRLIDLKGIGSKVQEDLAQKIELFLKSKGKQLFANVEKIAYQLFKEIKVVFVDAEMAFVGDFAKRNPILDKLMFIVRSEPLDYNLPSFDLIKIKDNIRYYKDENGFSIQIYHETEQYLEKKLFLTSNKELNDKFSAIKNWENLNENSAFEAIGLPFIPPVLRDLEIGKLGKPIDLIQEEDVLGLLHVHTNYSDGSNSLVEMVATANKKGFSYIGITDHSKSAFYANGLKEDRIIQQWYEIDSIQKDFPNIKIFKGIESDILANGNLDYRNDLLKKFDFIIASVHSNLKMDKEKATQRLIKAIENPYTNILGHLSSRLLLARDGYPLDMEKIIDACIANQVAIELNANPLRLDIDWKWIPRIIEKGGMIAINPDAHNIKGIDHIRLGVFAAQKGGLSSKNCLNVLNTTEFLKFLEK